jgi:hypothetical protein
MLIWFSFAYLTALGLKNCLDRLTDRRLALWLFVIYLGLVIIYNYPYFTGGFFDYAKGKSTMIQVPEYIDTVRQELNKNNFSTRTLYLPNTDTRTDYVEFDWGYFSVNQLTDVLGRKSAVQSGINAWPDEKNFIVNALSEYISFGTSNLAKLLGADMAVIRNDFISPDFEGNILSGINQAITKSPDFVFNKSIGRWDFYTYESEVLPLIFSPSKITFLSVDKEDLGISTHLPTDMGGAFVMSHYSQDASEYPMANKFIFEAKCADCLSTDTYQIYYAPSKFMKPGTMLYNFGKLIKKVRYRLTRNSLARIDINLAAGTTLISDLGVLQAKNDEFGIRVVTHDLIEIMDQIQADLAAVTDIKIKRELLKKVRYILSFHMSYESQWAKGATKMLIKSDLSTLESELTRHIAHIDSLLGSKKPINDPQKYGYWSNLATSGTYTLYIYAPMSTNLSMPITIDDSIYSAGRVDKNWLLLKKVPLTTNTLMEVDKQIYKSRPKIFAEAETNIPKFASPDIKFIALNQTKYLLKVSDGEKYMLGFNSRFDTNWSIRQISANVDKYFTGPTKTYQNGRVVEYARQDKHILTDLTFPLVEAKTAPSLVLNSISMGWLMDESGSEHTYLLEYNSQNVFYKSVAISLSGLFIVLLILTLHFTKKQHV